MDQNLHHVSSENINNNKKDNYGGNVVKFKWLSLTVLFAVQFVLSQLIFSYGVYTFNFVQIYKNTSILDALWSPLIYLASIKIFSPWCWNLSESYHESYFSFIYLVGVVNCGFGVALCYFFDSLLVRGLLYGLLGGLGSSLVLSLIYCRIYDLLPYETQLISGVQHIGIASGLFATPHFIQTLFTCFDNTGFVFLIHGFLLVLILLSGFVFQLFQEKPGFQYDAIHLENNAEEMIDMSNTLSTSRNWKSPSDQNVPKNDQNLTENEDQNENENENETESPTIKHKPTLSQIIEEDENWSEDETKLNKPAIITHDIKRLSVISTKLEELIIRDEINQIPVVQDRGIENFVNNNTETKHCCDFYQRRRFQRRIKHSLVCLHEVTLKPILSSICVFEFYPCLFTNLQSMFSSLIFFNLFSFKAYSDERKANYAELSFMFSVTAFAYFVFLITLPFILDISKRNLKYLYINGSLISALGIYILIKTKSEDNVTMSCLVYGFGFGVESFLREIVLKETLGVVKWSKHECTLEFLSGILFIILFVLFKQFVVLNKTNSELINTSFWIVLITHLIVALIWLIYPFVSYLRKYLFYKKRGVYNFS